MKDGFVKVAAVTPKIKVADTDYNTLNSIVEALEAYRQGAGIIVLPELCITGYTCQDLFEQETLLQGALKGLREFIAATGGSRALFFIGLPFEKEGRLYNAAAAVSDGKLLGLVPKRNLPMYAEFYEGRNFASGNETPEYVSFEGRQVPFGCNLIFSCENMPGLQVACELCEDLWVPVSPSQHHAQAGANLIVNLSASNETVGKAAYRLNLVSSTSARLVAGYLYCSAGEGESTQDLVFGGHNIICENGTVLAQSGRFGSGTIFADLDVQRLNHDRRKLFAFQKQENNAMYLHVPFRLKEQEVKLKRSFARTPFVPGDEKEREERCEEILSIQAHGLKKRLEHTGCQSAVIGLSGGLDSTLALLVTVKAFDLLGLDRAGIRCITMPCFGTTDRTYHNACTLAGVLGARLEEIDIKESVTLHFRDIGQDMDNHNVTYENGQARERTQILMDIANRDNGMVIGTGDMSELALGWATYNGDHMSMYGVNAGVPKTLVRHLVKYYADTCGVERLKNVLEDVLDTPVSPELLPPVEGAISQKTEDLVGPYELHDFFLYYMLRYGCSPSKIYRMACLSFEGSYEKETILKWLKVFYQRFFAQHFKRSCLPDGPKVGSVAVSPRGDLRMPTDASAAIWLKELERMEGDI
ncbi:MAG: NAD(+) synthase [Lachnospiraceae bacterium]|nr:NAD(+) synthase [Lachnospiraceae bacterium]